MIGQPLSLLLVYVYNSKKKKTVLKCYEGGGSIPYRILISLFYFISFYFIFI